MSVAALSLSLFLLATPAAVAAEEPTPPQPASLIATLLPPSALMVLTSLPADEPGLLRAVPETTQVLVGRINADGTKAMDCVDNDKALRQLLDAASAETKKKSRAEVQ